MDVIAEIEKLGFSSEDYIVFSGAALAARKIRETADIDILVSQNLFEQCEKEGWKMHPRITPGEKIGLENGIIELYPTLGGGLTIAFEELRSRAEMIDGIPFCSLKDLIHIKEAYGREKDLKDIELIKKYLDEK